MINENLSVISDAVDMTEDINSRLFDEVLLPLSGMEGRLNFATGVKSWDETIQNIEDEYVRETVMEVKEDISKLRKVIVNIRKELYHKMRRAGHDISKL